MTDKLLKKVIPGWFLYSFLLSLYSYLGDCILHFRYAMENMSFVILYFMTHMMAHFYLILPAIILYLFLFAARKGLLAFRILIAGVFATCICLFFYPDDWSLYIGEYKKVKQLSSYVLAAISLVVFDESGYRFPARQSWFKY